MKNKQTYFSILYGTMMINILHLLAVIGKEFYHILGEIIVICMIKVWMIRILQRHWEKLKMNWKKKFQN